MQDMNENLDVQDASQSSALATASSTAEVFLDELRYFDQAPRADVPSLKSQLNNGPAVQKHSPDTLPGQHRLSESHGQRQSGLDCGAADIYNTKPNYKSGEKESNVTDIERAASIERKLREMAASSDVLNKLGQDNSGPKIPKPEVAIPGQASNIKPELAAPQQERGRGLERRSEDKPMPKWDERPLIETETRGHKNGDESFQTPDGALRFHRSTDGTTILETDAGRTKVSPDQTVTVTQRGVETVYRLDNSTLQQSLKDGGTQVFGLPNGTSITLWHAMGEKPGTFDTGVTIGLADGTRIQTFDRNPGVLEYRQRRQ